MKAWAVCECGQPLQHLEWPTPEPEGTQVLLEVMYCGVCHSDLHVWEGYYDIGGGKRMTIEDRGIKLPVALGHEVVARVVKAGPDARGVQAGDVRIVYPWVGCGECPACRSEQDNMCARLRSIGVVQNGGYGTHVLAPHPRLLVDPGTVPLPLAATLACSGITVYAAIAKVLPLEPNEPIILVGAGGLGLNAINVLKALGHLNIIVVDIAAEKREAALRAGATKVVDGSTDDVAASIINECGGPVRAVIDFVNGSVSARFSLAALAKGGKLIQVGLFGGDLTIVLPVMASKALTIQGSFVGSPQQLRDLIALIEQGRLASIPIEEVPQDQVNDALMRLRDGRVNGRLVLRAAAA